MNIKYLYAGMIFLFETNAHAAGFINYVQSARSAGTGGALATVGEHDASAIFYNPAGLPKGETTQLLISTPIGKPSITFENQGTANILGLPVSGNQKVTEDIFTSPNIAVVSSLNLSTHIN